MATANTYHINGSYQIATKSQEDAWQEFRDALGDAYGVDYDLLACEVERPVEDAISDLITTQLRELV